jgi:hypothetical protein
MNMEKVYINRIGENLIKELVDYSRQVANNWQESSTQCVK